MAGKDVRREPSAAARALARTCRDQYDAFRQEGFTDNQAIMLVGEIMAAAAIRADDEDDD